MSKGCQKVLLGMVVVLLLCIKIFNLDADLPNWYVMLYTPLDEGPYAMQAIRFARPELVEQVNMLGVEGMREWNSSVSFLLTIFTTISLKLFGNNYYGLRMGVIVASLIISFLVLYIIRLLEKQTDKKLGTNSRGVWFLVITQLAFGFSFVFASRVVEPSVFRSLLVMLVVVYIYVCQTKQKNVNYFLLGVLSTFTVTWGYVTNIFVFVAAGVLLLYELIQYKNWKNCIKFLAGCIACFILSEIVMKLVQNRTFTEDTLRVLGHETRRVTFSILEILANIKAMLNSNMFAYNAVFFVLAFVGECYCLIAGFIQKNIAKIYSSMLICGFFLQGLVTSDFFQRKSIVIFPILLIVIVHWMIEFDEKACGKYVRLIKCGIIALSVIGWCNTFYKITNLSNDDMSVRFKGIFIIVTTIALVMLVVTLLMNKKRWGIIILALLISDICMDYEYIVSMDKTEKETMISLGKIVGNDYVLGNGYSYCLYNEIIPVSNSYDAYYLDEYIDFNSMLILQDKVKYFLGYQMGRYYYFDEMLRNTNDDWKEKIRFYTEYNVISGKEAEEDIYLYEVISKD